jgi:hypothetical protein
VTDGTLLSDAAAPGATFSNEPDTDDVDILDGSAIPLSKGGNGGAWAVLNLILALLCVAMAAWRLIAASVRRRHTAGTGYSEREDAEGGQRTRSSLTITVVSAILAAAGFILFVLTEDMRLTATLINGWTPLYAIITIAQFAVIARTALRFNKTREE